MIHFIVNPCAGSSRGIRTFRKLEPELIRYHLSYDVMFTQYPGHASEAAEQFCRTLTAPQIAVLGGDGTMHEVLEGIRAACPAGHAQVSDSAKADASTEYASAEETVPVTLMFLPCGSGNDFARGLHLTKDPAEFARALSIFFSEKTESRSFGHSRTAGKFTGRSCTAGKHSGRTHTSGKYSAASSGSKNPRVPSPSLIRLRYGCGHTQGVSQGFFVSGGMGFDSSVTEAITMSPLKGLANRLHLSTLAYLLLGIRQILTEPQAPARIVVDDRRQLKTDRLFFLSAHKMRCEGGGFPFAPDADPASDSLSVCIFYGMSRPACTWALFLSLFGLHRYKRGVALLNCKKVEVFSKTFRSTHTDGEPLGFTDHVCFTAGEGAGGIRRTASGISTADKSGTSSPRKEDTADIPIDFLLTACE
ncbi:MAG: hypothetical protein LUE29_11540 [Lachnospiraceae bacterium]|nr:hypothetical protein [Lachnospiraceae bacterium]